MKVGSFPLSPNLSSSKVSLPLCDRGGGLSACACLCKSLTLCLCIFCVPTLRCRCIESRAASSLCHFLCSELLFCGR